MGKARSTPTAKSPPAIVPSGESQWALVWREFRKRRLAFASVFVIVALVTLSIFAPFLANDRPIRYRGFNRFEYRESLRTLVAVLDPLAKGRGAADAAPKELAPGQKPSPPIDRAAVGALQLALMASHLDAERAAELYGIADRLPTLVKAASLPETSPSAEAAAARGAAIEEIKSLQADLQKRFDSRRVEFVSRNHWPVFAMLVWTDVVLLGFNIALLLLPAWLPLLRRVVRPELPSGRLMAGCLILFGMPLIAGGLWRLTVPERIDRTKYKQAVLANDEAAATAPVVFEAVTWPPIPFSVDEAKLDRTYLPPAAKGVLPEGLRPAWGEAASAPDDDAPVRKPPQPGRWDEPHWLGTDEIGRDLLARMLWGGRISLSVGIVATAIEVVLGVVFGAVAGYFRGWVDLVVSRIIEVVICFPSFFLILTIVAFVGPSVYNIMIVIGLTGWTGLARLVRGEFLRLADQEFVLAARALGYTPTRIIFRHVLPNAMAPLLVTATFAVAGAILIESGLSFLGLGITEPTPSWGGILFTGRKAIFRAPWIIYLPGLALFVTITAYNLVGEALRDAADPRLRGRI